MTSQQTQTSDSCSAHDKQNFPHQEKQSSRFPSLRARHLSCKCFSLGIVSVLFLLACISPSVVSAQMETIGELSFIVPKGWKYENKPGSPAGAVSLSDGRDYCMLIITNPLTVSPTMNIDFTTVWERIITPVLNDPPPSDRPYEHRSTLGYSGRLNGDTSPGWGQNRWVGLFLLETGTKAIPVIVVASKNEVYLHLYDTVVKFLDSVRLGDRASFVQKNQADQQSTVGERGAQTYYQEYFNEQQKRKELQREQRYEEQRHQDILQQQRRQGQLHQEMLQQQRRQEMLRQERRPR